MRHRLKQQFAAMLSAVMLFTMQPAAMAENIDISKQVFAGQMQTQINGLPETKELPEDDGTDGEQAQIDVLPDTGELSGDDQNDGPTQSGGDITDVLPEAEELPEDSRENDQSQLDADVIDAAMPELPGEDIEIQNTISYDAAASALIVQKQVQTLIDALPEAEEITADNRADVEAQLTAIDEAKLALTDEERAALDVTRYEAAIAALLALDDMSGADGPMTIEDVSYVDARGSSMSQSDVTVVDDSSAAWDEGWYVVNNSITVHERITVMGNVDLILTDDCSLTAEKGITVLAGNSLTIWGQSEGTGKLTATGGVDWMAGIGSNEQSNTCGAITINGGTIDATGGGWTAGIGGEGATITINGGTVRAVGGNTAAGIGGVSSGTQGCTITITGGTVDARGGEDGSGIGNGTSGVESKVTISGGYITATGRGWGTGISGDFSTGSDGKAVIVYTGMQDTIPEDEDTWSGLFYNSNSSPTEMSVYGEQTLTKELAQQFPSVTLNIQENAALTVESGAEVTLTGESSIAGNGKLINHGSIVNEGTVTNHGTIEGSGTVENKGNIKNDGTIAGSIAESITGNPLCTSCELTAEDLNFAVGKDYTPSERPISIYNNGPEDAAIEKVEVDAFPVFSASASKVFEIIEGNSTVGAGQTDTSWKIKPVGNLPVDLYFGVITIYYNGMDKTAIKVPVKFMVFLEGEGTSSSPALISDLEDLEMFRDAANIGLLQEFYPEMYFKLTDDINISSEYGADIKGGEVSWEPIGDDKEFQGTFDGGGHTISGLYINDPDGIYEGLFSEVGTGGTVKNLTVDGTVTSKGYCAGIVAYNKGTVENCRNICNIIAENCGGGVVGDNEGGTVTNCYNTGNISGSSNLGGIAGWNQEGIVTNCYNTGNISGSSVSGGVVGDNEGGTVTNCYYLDTASSIGVGNGDGDAAEKTSAEFASGEVAYLLQSGQKTQTWGQTVGSGTPELTSEAGKKVCKVIFATGDNEEYDVRYANYNGKVEFPDEPTLDGTVFDRWSTVKGTSGGEKFDSTTTVTGDITVYAVGRETFGGDAGEIALTTTYGEELTEDLSEHAAYKSGIETAGKFEYKITSGNDLLKAAIDGDNLSIPGTANAGDYTLTIEATEKVPQYLLMSVNTYGTDPVTLTVKVSIKRADSKVENPPTAAEGLTYTGAEQELLTGAAANTGGTMQYYMGEKNVSAPPAADAEWKTDISDIRAADVGAYTVWYRAYEDKNYTTSEPASVTVVINKAVSSVTSPPAAKYRVYDGTEQPLADASEAAANFGTLVYSLDKEGEYRSAVPTATDAGTYTVYYRAEGTDNWEASETGEITVTIDKADPVVVVNEVSGVYGEDITITAGVNSGSIRADLITSTVEFKIGETSLGDSVEMDAAAGTAKLTVSGTDREKQRILFGEDGSTSITAVYSGNENIKEGTGSGAVTVDRRPLAYTAVAKDRTYEPDNTGVDIMLTPANLVGDDNVTLTGEGSVESADAGTYESVSLSNITMDGADKGYYTVDSSADNVMLDTPVNISRAQAEVNTPPVGAENLVYNGTEQELLTSAAANTGGTMQYYVGEKNAVAPPAEDAEWKTDISGIKAADAGAYTVWYRAYEDSNYTAGEPGFITVIIEKGEGTASVAMKGYSCGETDVEPEPKSDTNGVENVTYTYKKKDADDSTYSETKPAAAGEYTVKAVFAETENYNGVTATADFVINHQFNGDWEENPDGYSRTCPCGAADIRMLETGLSEVPEGLKDMEELNTTEKITRVLVEEAKAGAAVPEENTAVYDVKLQVKGSGGSDWEDVTAENFPAEGVAVMLPYPEGTDSSYIFTVIHMITEGENAGMTEKPEVTNGEQGISFTVRSLSPICVGWTAPPEPSDPPAPSDPSTPSTPPSPPTPSFPSQTVRYGSLTVSKTVTGAGDTTREWHFRVELGDKSVTGRYGEMLFMDGTAEFTLKHGQSITARNLPAGTAYTVKEAEADQDGYATSESGTTGTVPDGDTARAEFTNHKDTPLDPELPVIRYGSLTVSKTVTGAGDTTREWHFRVELGDKSVTGRYGEMLFTDGTAEFALKHGQSITAEDLPAGTAYTVKEAEADQDGYATSESGTTGTVPDGDTARAEFTNHKDTPLDPELPVIRYGSLTVSKTVTGAGDTTREWHFRVELGDKSVTGRYGEMLFTDGTAEFTLKHGQSITAKDLPAGTAYTVEEAEADQDGYVASTSGATGMIPDDDTAQAGFVNHKDAETDPGGPPEEELLRYDMKVKLAVKKYEYTGKKIRPAVEVYLGNYKLGKGSYKVSYKKNRKIGTATVTVKGRGIFKGKTAKAKFKILPEKTVIETKKAVKKGILLSWNPKKNVSGYEIQYSTNKKFRNAKKVRVSGAKKESVILKGLKQGKKYYIRIRTYKKKTSGKKYKSAWSRKYRQKTK